MITGMTYEMASVKRRDRQKNTCVRRLWFIHSFVMCYFITTTCKDYYCHNKKQREHMLKVKQLLHLVYDM